MRCAYIWVEVLELAKLEEAVKYGARGRQRDFVHFKLQGLKTKV